MLNPEEDGKTHINIYSKGKTSIGRWLSNFTKCKIETEDGTFQSVEGYWYWLNCTHSDRDKLKSLHGYEAKKVGRALRAEDWSEEPDFKRKILAAIDFKIKSQPKVVEYLKANTKPFVHYYVYGDRVIQPEEGTWVVDFINNWGKNENN